MRNKCKLFGALATFVWFIFLGTFIILLMLTHHLGEILFQATRSGQFDRLSDSSSTTKCSFLSVAVNRNKWCFT